MSQYRRHDAAKENEKTMRITLDNYNLTAAERLFCESALTESGSIVEAAKLLGITRHGLKRRIIKHNIRWTPGRWSHRDDAADDGGMNDGAAGPEHTKCPAPRASR